MQPHGISLTVRGAPPRLNVRSEELPRALDTCCARERRVPRCPLQCASGAEMVRLAPSHSRTASRSAPLTRRTWHAFLLDETSTCTDAHATHLSVWLLCL